MPVPQREALRSSSPTAPTTGDGNRDLDFAGRAITVRSASDDPDSCIIDCQANESDPHRGFSFQSRERDLSVVQGLTITNGYATQGGGVYCYHSNPTLTHCTFRTNNAYSGGALCNVEGSATGVHDCMFKENTATNCGGGLYNYESSPTLIRCIFHTNYAHSGGALL